MLEEVLQWLRTYPGLEELQVDGVLPQPGSCGLYPRGVREEACRETVLGQRIRQYRQTYLLRRNGLGKEAAARWLLDFQNWVNRQTQFPQPGEQTRVRAQNGRLTAISPSGNTAYETELIFTYQVKEDA